MSRKTAPDTKGKTVPILYVIERLNPYLGWEPVMGDDHFEFEAEAREACASWSEMDYTEKLRVAVYERKAVLP